MEKDIRQSLQEHIFRLENRRRELMRPEYLRLGLTIGQGQPRILMYLLTEDGCSQREIAENCHLDVTTLSRTLDRLAEKNDFQEPILNRMVLEELLAELPEKERSLISLRYFQDKTQTQVAEVLGISQVQVSRLEKKILRKLRAKL